MIPRTNHHKQGEDRFLFAHCVAYESSHEKFYSLVFCFSQTAEQQVTREKLTGELFVLTKLVDAKMGRK